MLKLPLTVYKLSTVKHSTTIWHRGTISPHQGKRTVQIHSSLCIPCEDVSTNSFFHLHKLDMFRFPHIGSVWPSVYMFIKGNNKPVHCVSPALSGYTWSLYIYANYLPQILIRCILIVGKWRYFQLIWLKWLNWFKLFNEMNKKKLSTLLFEGIILSLHSYLIFKYKTECQLFGIKFEKKRCISFFFKNLLKSTDFLIVNSWSFRIPSW